MSDDDGLELCSLVRLTHDGKYAIWVEGLSLKVRRDKFIFGMGAEGCSSILIITHLLSKQLIN